MLEPPLTISIEPEEVGVRLVVVGDVDSDTAPLLDQAVITVVESGAAVLTVDFSGVQYLGSAGLSSLLTAQRQVPGFRLLRGNRVVDRLIDLTGLALLYGESHLVDHESD